MWTRATAEPTALQLVGGTSLLAVVHEDGEALELLDRASGALVDRVETDAFGLSAARDAPMLATWDDRDITNWQVVAR